MTLDQAIEDIKAGRAFAAVYQPRSQNAFCERRSRVIIRNIPTPGGLQLALHELDMTGRTSSGVYGEEMVRNMFAKSEERWRNSRFSAIDPADYSWLAFKELDLPTYLWAGLT